MIKSLGGELKKLLLILSLLLSLSMGQDYSLSFDGVDDYVYIPYSESINNYENSLTLEAWIKIDMVFEGSRHILARDTGIGHQELYKIGISQSNNTYMIQSAVYTNDWHTCSTEIGRAHV